MTACHVGAVVSRLLAPRPAGPLPVGQARPLPPNGTRSGSERCVERTKFLEMLVALCVALLVAPSTSLQRPASTLTRRGTLAAAATALLQPTAAHGSELWPKQGLFPDCAQSSCVSSQDDRPQYWDNPWVFEDALDSSMKALRSVVEKKLGGRVVAEDERYLRAEFEERSPVGGLSIDEAEFFLAPDDTLVQFRATRRGEAPDFGANRKRLEKARIALGWEKVPVLRNRRRALVVVESPLDSFGPARYSDAYQDTDPMVGAFKPPTAAERLWMRESDDRVRSK